MEVCFSHAPVIMMSKNKEIFLFEVEFNKVIEHSILMQEMIPEVFLCRVSFYKFRFFQWACYQGQVN